MDDKNTVDFWNALGGKPTQQIRDSAAISDKEQDMFAKQLDENITLYR